jgi:predicted MFS family arabinose efflux permease
VSVACLGLAGAVQEATLNNYLSEIFKLTPSARGQLEFPRELPGFLTALFAGALLFLPEARMGAIAALAAVVGFFGLAQVHIGYGQMVLWLFISSCGAHLMMPIETSLSIQLAEEGESGRRLGQVEFVRTLGMLAGALLVWKLFGRFHEKYGIAFLTAGGIAVVSAISLLRMPVVRQHSREPVRFIFRKRYLLFYILCVLFGVRKQVFITFGPWVLVKVFGQPPETIGMLLFSAGAFGLLFKPALGRMIDRLGERTILIADGLILVAVCLGYGYAGSWLPPQAAIYLLYACYVLDNLMLN